MVFFENIIEQLPIARAEHDHVMRYILVAFAGTEVPDKQTHRVFTFFNFTISPMRAMFTAD